MVKAKRKYGYEPDYAVPPGETLREVLASIGMKQKELALRTGLTSVSISRILNGEQPITFYTANLLELVTGIDASFWNNLEANYREQLLKLKTIEDQKLQIEWLKSMPIKELIERGYLPEENDKTLMLRNVLAFFGVGSVEAYRRVWEKPKVAARRSLCFETRPGPASVWIRIGEIEAMQMVCAPFDKKRFISCLNKIRELTTKEPDVFVPKMRELCAGAGVALVLVPEMKQVPWNGASKWLTPEKAMIILNLRGKGEDKFWFSFFHEASHILHDSKKALLINDGKSDTPEEKEADRFAAEILIPKAKYDNRIIRARSKVEILNIAEEIGISPGIVAVRYQYLTNKWSYFKDLIRRFEWA